MLKVQQLLEAIMMSLVLMTGRHSRQFYTLSPKFMSKEVKGKNA